MADVFVPHDIKTNIEFRHKEWYEDRVYHLLEKLQLGFVNVDLPRIPALPEPTSIVTNDVAYYRLHGRNKAAWYNPLTSSHRYDYLYNDAELEEWAGRVEGSLDAVKKAYVFGNNCHKGSSFVNALQLKQRFGQNVRSEAGQTLFATNSPSERIIELTHRVEAARISEKDFVEA